MITIKQNVTISDYRNAMFLHLRPRKSFAIVGILTVFFLLVAVSFKILSSGRWNQNAFIGLGCILYIALYFFCFLPWRAAKNYNQNKFYQHKTTCVMSESGIHTKSEFGDSNIPWSHVYTWKANSNLMLLYISDSMYLIFPKHNFDNGCWDEFVNIVKANVNLKR